MEQRAVTPCAEFPNDNPALHRGSIWRCLQLTGPAVCERPLSPPPVGAPEVAAGPLERAPEPEVAALPPTASEPPSSASAPEPPTDPAPPVLEADDDRDDLEIVDELAFDEVMDEPEQAPAGREGPAFGDPFAALAVVLEAVARAAGASEPAIALLHLALGRERVTAETADELLVLRGQAVAWQAILRGEGEDFAACGATALDEWSSSVIARAMGEMHRADGLRRELRRRGVAAFGLVTEAA